MNRDFYELCYRQYKHELEKAEGLYLKTGVMLVIIPLLGTMMVALGRMDVFLHCFTCSEFPRCLACVAAFLFVLAFVCAIVVLVNSIYHLYQCVHPRRYIAIPDMDMWLEWREEQRNEGENESNIETATFELLCHKLADAQSHNVKINQQRFEAFMLSLKRAAIALIVIGVSALFCLGVQVFCEDNDPRSDCPRCGKVAKPVCAVSKCSTVIDKRSPVLESPSSPSNEPKADTCKSRPSEKDDQGNFQFGKEKGND